MSNVVMVAGTKGGVGKSTTCINLARALQLRGKSVEVIDLDRENKTLMSYAKLWALRQGIEPGAEHAEGGAELQAPLPMVSQPSENFTSEYLARLAKTVDILLVDMPAGYGRDIGKVITVAGLVIMPTNLGAKDLGSALDMGREVATVAMRNKGLPVGRILVNNVDLRRESVRNTLKDLQESALPVPLMPYVVPHRLGLDNAGEQGVTVYDYPPTKELREVFDALAETVEQLLAQK